jgi:hypothetical protein
MTLWILSTGSMQGAGHAPCAVRQMHGGCAGYLAMVLATVESSAPFSAAPVCWLAHSPSTAAMNRRLAKLTDFMARHSTSPRVIAEPARDGSDGA